MKLSDTQKEVIELLRDGNFISYFRGIGTRFKEGASVENGYGKNIKNISVATVKSLRDKSLLQDIQNDGYHSKYTLTELGKTISID